LITESQTCLPQELVEEHEIQILPFLLLMGERQYRDGIDISAAQFYNELPTLNGTVVKTASVSPGEYLRAFEEASREHEAVLAITISNKMSASYQSAMVAAQQFERAPVQVFDSGTAAAAQGLVVLEVAKAIRDGAGLDEAAEVARRTAGKVELYAYIDTFDYLRQSGHVRAIQALAATALSIKPVFRFKDGDADLVGKKRNNLKAKKAIAQKALQSYESEGPLNLNVFHANDLAGCQELQAMIQAKAATASVLCTEFTPVMGAHTGPGVVGAAFLPANHWH
jgi:DegV family protein with EDD domain